MIENYRDHAANERTYLAWVRTALAFMGFGLVVERFDLLLRSARSFAGKEALSVEGLPPHQAGTALILLGVLVLAISSYRYLRFKRLIADLEMAKFQSSRSDLVLVFIVSAIAVFMLGYIVAQVF